jgi:hypothetical protein
MNRHTRDCGRHFPSAKDHRLRRAAFLSGYFAAERLQCGPTS